MHLWKRILSISLVFIFILLLGFDSYSVTPANHMAKQVYLELDGVLTGLLVKADGGLPYSEVANNSMNGSGIFEKNISEVRYHDIHIEIVLGSSKVLNEWIANTLKRQDDRRDGAIVTIDGFGKVTSRLHFSNAFISEVTFPGMDISSIQHSVLKVTIIPEFTKLEIGAECTPISGTLASSKVPLLSNVSVSLNGTINKIIKIEPFTVSVKVVETGGMGDDQDYMSQAGTLEEPDLTVCFLESDLERYWKWYSDFVQQGNNDDSYEKSMGITYLNSSGTRLFTLNLTGVGPYDLELVPGSSYTAPDKYKMQLYVENISMGR